MEQARGRQRIMSHKHNNRPAQDGTILPLSRLILGIDGWKLHIASGGIHKLSKKQFLVDNKQKTQSELCNVLILQILVKK